MEQNYWHSLTTNAVLEKLNSTPNGLTHEEATNRLAIYGHNQLEAAKEFNVIHQFLKQFNNALIYVLLTSAIFVMFLHHIIDSSIIFFVIVTNAILGVIQEGKSAKALSKVNTLLAPKAYVLRDNTTKEIPGAELVPGDIVLLKAGDKVPADLRLLLTKNLQIQESILTGEAHAVGKDITPVKQEAMLGDHTSMAYSGTTITYGKGRGVVIATGKDSQVGRINQLLTNVKTINTPLLDNMNKFGNWLTMIIVVLAIITVLIGVVVWKQPFALIFMAAISFAVAAIPEGLPPVLTIILAIGVGRMAKRNAIVRKLPAVETMGAVTVICTDKTGTLTQNQQIVQNIIDPQQTYFFNPNDQICVQNSIIPNIPSSLLAIAKGAILCTDRERDINPDKQKFTYHNPIDQALISMALKLNLDIMTIQNTCQELDTIPYSSENKYMATLHTYNEEKNIIYVKGAPEIILAMCSYQQNNHTNIPLEYEYWIKQITIVTKQGYRLLAISCKETLATKNTLEINDITTDLILLGLIGFIDPPRTEAISAVRMCYAAKIIIKMITGDHPQTALTIADQVGIDHKNHVLLGSDLEKMNHEELCQAVKNIHIYARTSPEHKIKLVQALQANGEIVAMTGDGVNDSPALRQANIGIAMGKKGAAIAIDASTIVLADDNFATIVSAIAEGRVIFDNLRKAIIFLLPTNFAMSLIMMISVLCGLTLPMTPLQVLWINTISAISLSSALGFEAAEIDLMHKPPRNTHKSILSKFFIWQIFFITLILVVSIFYMFIQQKNLGIAIAKNHTMAVNLLVLGEIVWLLQCRSFYQSALNTKTWHNNKYIFIAIIAALIFQLLFTYVPLINSVFKTTGLDINDWIYLLQLSGIMFVIIEIEKSIIRSVL